MATLQCEIVTPEKRLYAEAADFVVLPAAEGEMGVLPKHEPVVATLNAGSVRVTPEGAKEPIRYLVLGGYAQVDGEQVIVLADRAIAVDDIDKEACMAELEGLKAKLDGMADDDPNRAFIESEVKWNELLLA